MLYEIILIFICLFAALGMVDLALYIFNKICTRRLPGHRLYIFVDDFKGENAEYLLRFLEEYIVRDKTELDICGLLLGKNAEVDDELLSHLKNKYRNIDFYRE